MRIIGVAGLPAAGKTAVSEELSEQLDTPMIEMGDVVEQKVAEYHNVAVEDLTSDMKGETATVLREEEGEQVFAYETVELVLDFEEDIVIVSGVRTPEEIDVFENHKLVSDFELVFVKAPFENRYKRLVSRGREDEGNFSRQALVERDERELDWGLREICYHKMYSYAVVNDGELDELSEKVASIVDSL